MKKHRFGSKWFVLFAALALSLCLCLGALAEAGTLFPWLDDYTLDVALVSTDPETVNDPDAPSGGAIVMVKLISPYGTVSTEDIEAHCEKIRFRDADGDEYAPYSWRVRGVDFDDAKGFSTKPQQDGFELLYFLEGKTADGVSGAQLLIPTGVEGERVVVSLDKAPHGGAGDEAPEAEEASAGIGASFVLGGVRYIISTLEDQPPYVPQNFMDGKEGHLVAFSYAGPGKEAEKANDQLYDGARLIQPNGDLVRAYCNSDNIGNPYELFFGLSGDVLLGDCVFTIQGDEGEVRIPLSGQEAAGPQEEATPEPAPESSPLAPQAAATEEPAEALAPEPSLALSENPGQMEQKIAAVLTQCAEGVTDEWQLAIYRAGVQGVQADPEKEGVYAFRLRSFNPGLKDLGKYQGENKQGYLARLLENARAYDLEASLTLAEGEFTAKSVKALQSAVKKAAAASLKAFKDTRVLSAIVEELLYDGFGTSVKKAEDLLSPSPEFRAWISQRDGTLSSHSAEQWVAFFYGQVKQSLDVAGGPYALTLKCTGVDMAQLLENAGTDALQALAFMPYDQRWEEDRVEGELLRALADNALAMKKKGKEVLPISLNVDGEPLYSGDYEDMLAAYAYSGALEDLRDDAQNLPDEAAQEFPKAGWLSGSKSGTQVRVKAPKDSVAYYVQLREYDTNELAVAGFVRPGSTCVLRVPKGDYYFVMASGSIWYGEEALFGDETDFSKTGLFEVKSSKYYHTVTLKVVEGGNMPVYGADEEDLQ